MGLLDLRTVYIRSNFFILYLDIKLYIFYINQWAAMSWVFYLFFY